MEADTKEPTLLEEVERFLEKNPSVAETRLGRDAMGDPNFVRALREGRVVRPATVQRVRSYIQGKSVS